MSRLAGPCLCGAEDCRRCYPEHFRNGRYIFAECKTCGGEFVPEDDGEETTCPTCKAKQEQGED